MSATELPGFFGANPGMAFVMSKPGGAVRPTIPGPPLVLTQGQPTAIRIANQMSEPLAVHWHGIELESYYDGVPGVSGSGQRLLPPIGPGESFVAQFTPPRAGTFIYHSHLDGLKQLSWPVWSADRAAAGKDLRFGRRPRARDKPRGAR